MRSQNIVAMVSKASYILDDLLMNETDKWIKEQNDGASRFNDHVFAV